MDLFDLFVPDESVCKPSGYAMEKEKCPHPKDEWKETETVWGDETFARLTWTCQLCGTIRGRA